MASRVKHLRIRLRECLALYKTRTGKRLSHVELARKAKLSKATIDSIASRQSYNATMQTIERLCGALGVGPAELLEWRD